MFPYSSREFNHSILHRGLGILHLSHEWDERSSSHAAKTTISVQKSWQEKQETGGTQVAVGLF